MKQLILSITLMFIVFCGFGQQNTQFTQWVWNPLSYNPALSGIKSYSEFKTMSRLQWIGFQGAPTSNSITYTAQLPTKRKEYFAPRHGIGAKFENDYIGPFSTLQFALNYAVHFNYTEETRLSIGLSGGARQFAFDNTNMTALTPDPAVNKGKTVYSPTANLGFWWNGKNYYVGLSLDQLTNSSWSSIGIESKFRTHFLLSSGVKWTQGAYSFIPNVLIKKTIGSPIAFDLTSYLDYKNQFKFGIGLRNKEAFLALFQIRIKDQFAIGYSIDYITNGLNTNTLFSHEISLHYSSFQTKDTDKLSCPLF